MPGSVQNTRIFGPGQNKQSEVVCENQSRSARPRELVRIRSININDSLSLCSCVRLSATSRARRLVFQFRFLLDSS
mgnify:CR=1 FL=1